MNEFSQLTDSQLVVIVQTTGHNKAFSELVLRHQSKLCAFLNRSTGSRSMAEDLTQETFIKSFNKISSFKQDSTFKTWLFSIGYREFLQSKRKSSAFMKMIERFKESVNPTHSSNIDLDLNIDLQSALNELSKQQRAAVLLCDACGMSHTEASIAMDVPLGSLKTYVKQAREKLNVKLSSNTEL
jgi:RNA polymerase sigma-70 factor (ECF subfamily)